MPAVICIMTHLVQEIDVIQPIRACIAHDYQTTVVKIDNVHH